MYKPMRVLIDGDMFAYLACQQVEQDITWDNEIYSRYTHLTEAFDAYCSMVDDAIDAALAELQERVSVYPCHCFSDPHHYFRCEVMPTYKANRQGTNKPVGYRALIEKISQTFRAIMYKDLEADDVIGILATRYTTESVIISGDKDMKTIPAPQYDFMRKTFKRVSEEEAFKAFLTQALTGDSTDGYGGVPSIGPKTAEKLFNKNGWTWETVLNAYKDKGLTELDALRNARCAYILHNEDYDEKEGVIHLWNPRRNA